ncbi:MAG: HDIG domain-containing protein [Peptococcaceae bacterium]|nr:HDIG domain-containing protein [Peptococcaceae bacterium]
MERVRAIVSDLDYNNYLRMIAEAEVNRVYCKHDYHHALSVARLAYLQALEAAIDSTVALKPVIYAAGLLHDIGRWQEYLTGKDHALVGAHLAAPILEKHGFSGQEVGMIVTGISEHRSPQVSWLGKMLATADDLCRECYRCESTDTCYKAKKMIKLHDSLLL